MARFTVVFSNQEATNQSLTWESDVDCALVAAKAANTFSGLASVSPEKDLNADEFSVTGTYPRSIFGFFSLQNQPEISPIYEHPVLKGETVVVNLNAGVVAQLIFESNLS